MHDNGWPALESRAFVSRREAVEAEYVQQFRMPMDLFIQPAANTTSVVAITDRGRTRAITQTLQWTASSAPDKLLDFSWRDQVEHDLDDLVTTWYHDGKEIVPANALQAGTSPDDLLRWCRATFDRCAAGGAVPGALQLLMRQHGLVQQIGTRILNPNQPCLLVPKAHHRPVWEPGQPIYAMANPAIDHVLSGAGPIKSPLYFQLKALMKAVSGLAPWQMFRRAGSCAAIVMSDIIRAGKEFERALTETVTELFKHPLEMLGFGEEQKAKAARMLGSKAGAVRDMVPWWYHDTEDRRGYLAPDPSECLILGRRVDTCRAYRGRDQPGINLGLPRMEVFRLRQTVDPVAGSNASGSSSSGL